MTIWNIHLLNARHDLTRVLSEVRQASRDAVARAADHADLPDFDLVVRAQQDRSADGAIQGHAPAPGVIEIALIPDRFEPAAFTRALIRQIAHLIRSDIAGHRRSLGEALVSEGLAGHFVLRLLGGQPDPRDTVQPAPGLPRRAANEWARLDYDHPRWFLGKGDLRKWAGYGLGHRLIAEHLAQAPDPDAVAMMAASAETFRPALRRLVGSDTGPEAGDADASAPVTGAEPAPDQLDAAPDDRAGPAKDG